MWIDRTRRLQKWQERRKKAPLWRPLLRSFCILGLIMATWVSPLSATAEGGDPPGSTPAPGGYHVPYEMTGVPLGNRLSREERPVRLKIPAIDVDADIEAVGLDQHGAMGLPQAWDRVGWYRGSAAPGQWGTSVLAGHVDHYTGPAVFFNLKRLDPGDEVIVTAQSGTEWRYRVVEQRIKPRNAWKVQEVFKTGNHFPSLHLFSCTGAFSRSAQTHLDRILIRCELDEVVAKHR